MRVERSNVTNVIDRLRNASKRKLGTNESSTTLTALQGTRLIDIQMNGLKNNSF